MSVIKLEMLNYIRNDYSFLDEDGNYIEKQERKPLKKLIDDLCAITNRILRLKKEIEVLEHGLFYTKEKIISENIYPLKLGCIYTIKETSGKTKFKTITGKLSVVKISSDPMVLILVVYPITKEFKISQRYMRLYNGVYEFTETKFKEVDDFVT